MKKVSLAVCFDFFFLSQPIANTKKMLKVKIIALVVMKKILHVERYNVIDSSNVKFSYNSVF